MVRNYKILTGQTAEGIQQMMNLAAAEGFTYEPGSLAADHPGGYIALMSKERDGYGAEIQS